MQNYHIMQYMANFVTKKNVFNLIKETKKYLLFLSFVVLAGIVVGVVVQTKTGASLEIYSANSVALADIISGTVKKSKLFFSAFLSLSFSVIILFVFSLTSVTSLLKPVYIFYQSILLGSSLTSLVLLKGVSGIINLLIFVLPVNILNFLSFIIFSAVLNLARKYAKNRHISFLNSLFFFKEYLLLVVVLVLFSCFLYGVIYPILVKSVVVINY